MKNRISFAVCLVGLYFVVLGAFLTGAYHQYSITQAALVAPVSVAFSKPATTHNHDNDCEPLLRPHHGRVIFGGGLNEHVVINGAMLVPAAPPTMDYCGDDEPAPERRHHLTKAFLLEQHNMRAATEHGLLTAIEEVKGDIIRCKKAPDYVKILKEELEVLERRLRDLE